MRTGSLIGKSICILVSGALISCAQLHTNTSDSEVQINEEYTEISAIPDKLQESESVPHNESPRSNILLSDQSGGISILQEMRITEDKFIIKTEGEEPVVNVMTLTSPPRLVVDLLGAKGTANKELYVSEESSVSSVRVGSHSDKLRVVFDLKTSHSAEGHSVDASNGEIMVSVPVTQEIEQARLASLSGSFSGMAQMKSDEAENNQASKEISRASHLSTQDKSTRGVDQELDSEIADLMREDKDDISDFLVKDETADFKSEYKTSQNDTFASSQIDKPVLSKIDFKKSSQSSGEVTLTLSEEVAFEMHQTSQSEYLLSLPGVHVSESAKKPLVSLKGKEGIRSVRISEENGSVEVRMFIDPGTFVNAFPRGNVILVRASEPVSARQASSRGQLGQGEGTSSRKT
jgi:hypothetical protein